MEIRIGIIQSVREITLEIDDEKAQSKFKAASEAALAGKTETLTVKATVKEHGEREGVKQTKIARPV